MGEGKEVVSSRRPAKPSSAVEPMRASLSPAWTSLYEDPHPELVPPLLRGKMGIISPGLNLFEIKDES